MYREKFDSIKFSESWGLDIGLKFRVTGESGLHVSQRNGVKTKLQAYRSTKQIISSDYFDSDVIVFLWWVLYSLIVFRAL